MELQKFYEGLDNIFQNKNPRKAGTYLEFWLKIAEEENDSAGIIAVCNELGSFSRALGDLERAKAMYRRVFMHLEMLGQKDTENYATALINLGVVYVWEHNEEEAVLLFLQAEQILLARGFGEDYRMAALYNDISMAYRGMKDLASAERILKKAFHIIEKYPRCRAELATTFVNLGEIQTKRGNFSEAEKSFLSAIDIFEKELQGLDVHYASACSGMGELSYLKGELEAAEAYYEKSLILIERDFGRTPAYELVAKNLAKVKKEKRIG